MTDTNFKVIFRGSAVDNGEIDVRDLAPALLALGDVFQAASDVLNGDRVRTAVRVKATEAALSHRPRCPPNEGALIANGE